MSLYIFEDCGRIAYPDALAKQTAAFDHILAAKAAGGHAAANRLFFCEHDPVITLGKRAKEANILVPEAFLAAQGVSLYRTDRGGDVTYHGPGQITAYPVFDLDDWRIGLRAYIHRLEEIVIAFLRHYRVEGRRIAGMTGVWTGDAPRKICAIGVRSSRFVAMHGFALNINTPLAPFTLINPCGFTDRPATSLAAELGAEQDFDVAKERLLGEVERAFGRGAE